MLTYRYEADCRSNYGNDGRQLQRFTLADYQQFFQIVVLLCHWFLYCGVVESHKKVLCKGALLLVMMHNRYAYTVFFQGP